MSATALGAARALNAQEQIPLPATRQAIPNRRKLCISTFSFRNLSDPKNVIENTIEQAAALGINAVDIQFEQMPIDKKPVMDDSIRAYCRKIRRLAFRSGVGIAAFSVRPNFVSPDQKVREEAVASTLHCVEIGSMLGASCFCLIPGRWNTIPEFEEYMKVRGLEPPIAGHSEDEAFEWSIDSLRKCARRVEELGMSLAIENHWGLSRTPEGLLRILAAFDSPSVGALMDTGNFLEDPYDKLNQIAPKTIFVHAKTYFGGGEWYTVDLDYTRIATMLNNANYAGYISLQMEGKEDPRVAVPKSLEVLRAVLIG